jgi:hypothetical protein
MKVLKIVSWTLCLGVLLFCAHSIMLTFKHEQCRQTRFEVYGDMLTEWKMASAKCDEVNDKEKEKCLDDLLNKQETEMKAAHLLMISEGCDDV